MNPCNIKEKLKNAKNKTKNLPNFPNSERGNAAKVAVTNPPKCKQIQASHCEDGIAWN